MTSIDLTLNLPDRLARAAKDAGLLSPRGLARLLRDEMRREAARQLREAAARASAGGGKPMSLMEIQREVDAVRKEQRLAAQKAA
jgi:hypothetical protein